MARTKKQRKASPPAPSQPAKEPTEKTPPSQSLRETVESIVIAFVLAFLFRTFEAEAFVIPTGSMAPTLMGRHKDVFCTQCGERFQITASEEENDEIKEQRARLKAIQRALRNEHLSPEHKYQLEREVNSTFQLVHSADCLAGICPNCRYTMPVDDDLPAGVPELRASPPPEKKRSYAGDRILVNKYIYSFTDPQRWDVVVFKFPGNAQQNYIKRLVGLPGETLRIYQGDLFVADNGQENAAFEIARKPASKVRAMRQLVHDTDHDPTDLYEAGWPLRWSAAPDDAGWEMERDSEGEVVRQKYIFDTSANETSWIRYQHFIPDYETWLTVEGIADAGDESTQLADPRPQLIRDFNAYNARINRRALDTDRFGRPTLAAGPDKLGLHWVGDLTVEADVRVESDRGELLLDLVEAGQHFTARIDLATGKATLEIDGLDDFAPTASTSFKGQGNHRVALANVDDQLCLWIDDKLVEFDAPTTYDAEAVFGPRDQMRPQSSPSDPGDLAPAGIGALGAQVEIDRLRVYRDIYYIATNWEINNDGPVRDMTGFGNQTLEVFFSHPEYWDAFLDRRSVSFPLTDDQFFVMGDNSPESLDSRLWRNEKGLRHSGLPGGSYLERDLLIGKALCVYWPHSWYHIPGTPIPVFPNFADMRLVR